MAMQQECMRTRIGMQAACMVMRNTRQRHKPLDTDPQFRLVWTGFRGLLGVHQVALCVVDQVAHVCVAAPQEVN